MAKTSTASEQPDRQTQTAPGEVFEVLTQTPNGHRTVHRLCASDRTAAERVVENSLDEGARLLGSSLAGHGLGSGD